MNKNRNSLDDDYNQKLKKLSSVERAFVLEDYPAGKTVEIQNVTYKVTHNDRQRMVLVPIVNNIWYKTWLDKKTGKTKCRYIEKNKIVEKTM